VPEYLKRQQYRKTLVWAEQLVHEAMLLGLEWAINSPRAFVNDAMMMRFYDSGGAAVTDIEAEAIKEVSKRLLDRLRKSDGLWRKKVSKNLEFQAERERHQKELVADLEAEAIALGARPRR
jgi:hypothetical protein